MVEQYDCTNFISQRHIQSVIYMLDFSEIWQSMHVM